MNDGRGFGPDVGLKEIIQRAGPEEPAPVSATESNAQRAFREKYAAALGDKRQWGLFLKKLRRMSPEEREKHLAQRFRDEDGRVYAFSPRPGEEYTLQKVGQIGMIREDGELKPAILPAFRKKDEPANKKEARKMRAGEPYRTKSGETKRAGRALGGV